MTAALSLLLLNLLACERQEPVLTGVPAEPILGEVRSASDERADHAAPEREPAPYEPAPNVYVDVLHLGGKTFSTDRDLVLRQMGALQDSRPLHGDLGEELIFERGRLRVTGDRIYFVEVPLPEPMRRAEALAVLGFPAIVDDYLVFSHEFRLHHEWGFRRLSMRRLEEDSELVTHVKAWKWLPGEHNLRLQ